MKQNTFMQLYKKMSGTQAKNIQQIHSALDEDVNNVQKTTNQDNAWHMERVVTNMASSTNLKMYTEVPGAAWSTPLKMKLYTNKSLALKQ